MPEAITKYAVNSTLGTDNFQPLDQMIVGQKMFVASDTPIAILDEFSTHSTSEIVFARFKPKISGTIKVKCQLDASAYSSPRGYFSITGNGGIICFHTAKTDELVIEETFEIKEGNIYSFSLQTDSASTLATVTNLMLMGDIVDSNWFTFEKVDV